MKYIFGYLVFEVLFRFLYKVFFTLYKKFPLKSAVFEKYTTDQRISFTLNKAQ